LAIAKGLEAISPSRKPGAHLSAGWRSYGGLGQFIVQRQL